MRIALFAALLAGCGSAEDRFNQNLAGGFCDRWHECYAADFEDFYADVGECTDGELDNQLEWVDDNPDCTFVPDRARPCLDALDDVSCGGFADYDAKWWTTCDKVYAC